MWVHSHFFNIKKELLKRLLKNLYNKMQVTINNYGIINLHAACAKDQVNRDDSLTVDSLGETTKSSTEEIKSDELVTATLERTMEEESFPFMDLGLMEGDEERIERARQHTRDVLSAFNRSPLQTTSRSALRQHVHIEPEIVDQMKQWVNGRFFKVIYNSKVDSLKRIEISKRLCGCQRFMIIVDTSQYLFGGYYLGPYPVPPSVKAVAITRKDHFGFIFSKAAMSSPTFLKPKDFKDREDKSIVVPALDEYVDNSIISSSFFIILMDGRYIMSRDLPNAYTIQAPVPGLSIPVTGTVAAVYGIQWM